MGNVKQYDGSVKPDVMGIHSGGLITSSRIWLEVKDVMNKDVVTISSEQTVLSALRAMSEKSVSCIVVVDTGHVVGILTERDLLKRLAKGQNDFRKMKVSQVMSFPVESVTPNLSVFDCSSLMEEKNIKRLPILRDKQLIGILTQTDLTRALTSYVIWKDVAEIMSTNVAVVQTKATVAEAAERMNTRNISCIIAMEANQVKGIVTERDLLKRIIAHQKDPGSVKVEQVMSSPAVTIPSSFSVFSAQKLMEKMNIHRLVVIDEGRLTGIITQTDTFRALKKKLQEDEEKNLRLLALSKGNIYTLDLEGRVTYVNPAFAKLFEVDDPAELIGQPFLPERFWIDPAERNKYLSELEKRDVEIETLPLKS